MRGLQKSKRVYWAPDVNLCQVRLFLSEECPSQVGFGAQDHLQAKATWLPHLNTTAADDILPPGFEVGHPGNLLQIKVSEVPVIKWKYPPRFVADVTWQVAAGEESKEVEVQNQREMRILEAVYPRPSAIPPNPTFTTDIEDSQHNDNQIPLIPILPIEDEDTIDTTCDSIEPCSISVHSQSNLLVPGFQSQHGIPNMPNISYDEKSVSGVLLGVEPDVVTAASAAFSAINKGNENGSLIDQELLMKILSDSKSVEKLVKDYGPSATSRPNIPQPIASSVPLSDSPSAPVALSDPYHFRTNRVELNAPQSLLASLTGSIYYTRPNGFGQATRVNGQVPPPGDAASSAGPPVGAPQVKDMNYYKSLIQQHGGERQEAAPQQYGNRYNHQIGTNQEMFNPKSQDSKPKVMKPCIYFNSSRGCRHGANCAYQHDTSTSQQRGSSSISEVQSAKRMKMDREISSS